MTKKKGRGKGPKPPKMSPMERVSAALEEKMDDFGYPEPLIETALRMWEIYYAEHTPRIRSAGGQAASIEYVLIHFHVSGFHVTQQELAERYGTTPATISRVSNLMFEFFDGVASSMYLPVLEDEDDFDDEFDDPDVIEKLAGVANLLAQDGGLPYQELLPPELLEALKELPKTKESWVGGRRTVDVYVREPELYRPDVVLWADASGHPILGQMLLPPGIPDPIAAMSLAQAMVEPDMGSPRCPQTVTVANQELVKPLQDCFGFLGITVKFGAVKVVDAIVTLLESHLNAPEEELPEPNYTHDGAIPEAVVAQFFDETAQLYQEAPWSYLHDSAVFGVDLFRDGYERASVIVIGAAGQCFGLLVFESLEAYMAMTMAGEMFDESDPSTLRPPPIDVMSIEFERGADLPSVKRQECMKHGWTVVNSQAYPNLEVRMQLSMLRPLETKDYRIASIITHAMTAFFQKHKKNLKKQNPKACSLEVPSEKGSLELPVTVCYPHPDYNRS